MSRVTMLSGEKIDLLILDKQDIDLLYSGMNNLEINKYLVNLKDIYHREDIEKLYDEIVDEKDSVYFSIYDKKSKKVIGICGIKNIKDLSNQGELYLFIYDKNNQNKGYGTEVVELLIKYGFEILGVMKLGLSYIEGNENAKKVYVNSGFKEVGRFKEDVFIRGKLKDQIFMEIYKKNYK